METMSRRVMIAGVLCGAVGGVVLAAEGVAAMPIDATVGAAAGDPITKAQVVVVNPHRRPRRRRWVCWWRRGRRVCGWRWV